MRKVTAITASVLTAAAIAVPSIANAQADTTTDTTTNDTPDQAHRRQPGLRLDTVASTIGITMAELRQQMVDGLTIAEVAAANGVSADTVAEAILAEMQSHLADEVTEGDLTQEQADQRLANRDQVITDLLNGTMPPGQRGFDPDRDGRRHGPGPGFDMNSTLPDLLGIDPTELRTQLLNGSTLAQIAEANGVAVDEVIGTLVTEATARLDSAVTDGKLTQAQADEAVTNMTQRITDMVNGTMPPGERGFGHRGFGPDGGHRGGFGPDARRHGGFGPGPVEQDPAA